MTVSWVRLLLAFFCVQASWCVTPSDLQSWFESPSGLAMAPQEASTLAYSSSATLTQCGVTVKTLQALKDVLYDHTGMDLEMAALREVLLPLAEHHVSPDKVNQFYQLLSTSYTLSGGLGYGKADAQKFALKLLMAPAEPDQLKALYQVVYGYYGLGFKQALAQSTAMQLAVYGSDAAQFKESYTQAKGQGSSDQAALQLATEEAVKANLLGLVRRYAGNGNAYTADDFQQYYGTKFLSEWGVSPLEMRVSTDHRAYTASQFSRHFSSGTWAAKYRVSPEATQERLANDGKAYSIYEFQQFYSDSWRERWSVAPELACKECSPYAAEEESASLIV